MNLRWPALALLLALTSCRTGPDDLDQLTDWMTGSFSSASQSAADPSYYEIQLHMVPIWQGRDDGPWLYVEQAAASRPERPYRQRVYRLGRREDGSYVSEVYTLPGPERFAGAWRDPSALDALAVNELELRVGCAVILRRKPDGSFAGGTRDVGCSSSLQGAAYATSEVVVLADRIESWDRGFDAAGQQVWGAEAGPYVFTRQRRD